jgi:hypothetical protein
MTQSSNPEAICCPPFDPTPWDDKTFEWRDKPFIKDQVFTLFYIPINFGKAMVRMQSLTEKAGAKMPDYLCLSDHTSKWNMDLYLAVDKEIPGAKNVTLSGKFFCKVYEGDFKETGKWCGDFAAFAKEKGYAIKKQYLWYTTCPKCSKKYGKNYVVLIAEI